MTKAFGGVTAVKAISFHVQKGEILGLIGPNGAGKTTVINMICGYLKPDSGNICFKGANLENLSSYKIARMGVGRTFQISRIFKKMTTLENVMVPATWLPGKFEKYAEKAIELLNLLDLIDLKDEFAGNLSGGQQRLLELARASMMDPDLLVLDEPFHGIHPILKDKIISYVVSRNETSGKTIIISSHDMPSIMRLCERLVVMNAGDIIADGAPKDIQADGKVVEIYLGTERESRAGV